MIVIDPGHGGSDPGGGSNNLWKEKDITLDISLYQFKRFNELGIPVKMTRFKDETLSPEERTKRFNEASGKSSSAVGISNHVNKNKNSLDGAEVYYSINENNTLPVTVAEEFRRVGQNTRQITQRLNSRGTDYYFIIRNTRPTETILVEYGFADSPYDDINQIENNRDNLAEAVVRAVAKYKNYAYTPPKGKGLNEIVYQVKRGDTIDEIAQSFSVDASEIRRVNNISGNDINADSFIRIPLNVDLVGYRVKNGDNLYKLADEYDTTISKIMAYNQLKELSIDIGDVLLLPKKS